MNDNLPSSAFGVVRLFPDTKQGIEMFSTQLIRAVENGEVDALQLKAYFKAMEKVIEKVDKSTRDSQMTQAEKYGEKKFRAHGMQIEIAEVGTKYDYESCGDIEWERWDSSVKSAEESRKNRETFLKTLKEPMTLVNEETGEVYKVRPPVKRSTTGLKFTI